MYEQKTYLAIALLVGEVRLENGRANNERENDDKRGREYVSQPASQSVSQSVSQPVSFVSQAVHPRTLRTTMVSYEHFSAAEAAAFTFTAYKICTNANMIARLPAPPREEKRTEKCCTW